MREKQSPSQIFTQLGIILLRCFSVSFPSDGSRFVMCSDGRRGRVYYGQGQGGLFRSNLLTLLTVLTVLTVQVWVRGRRLVSAVIVVRSEGRGRQTSPHPLTVGGRSRSPRALHWQLVAESLIDAVTGSQTILVSRGRGRGWGVLERSPGWGWARPRAGNMTAGLTSSGSSIIRREARPDQQSRTRGLLHQPAITGREIEARDGALFALYRQEICLSEYQDGSFNLYICSTECSTAGEIHPSETEQPDLACPVPGGVQGPDIHYLAANIPLQIPSRQKALILITGF